MKAVKKNIVKSFIFSKICITQPHPFTDSSHAAFLLGQRKDFFSLLNPFLLKTSLKIALLAIEMLVRKQYRLIFITDISDSVLFTQFYFACKKKNFLVVKKSEVSLGFLTTLREKNVVLVTLFLPPLRTELIQQEAALVGTPVISFGSLLTNRSSSVLQVGGNFNVGAIQHLIVTLLTVCLEKKHELA